MLPDDVIGLLECDTDTTYLESLEGRHEVSDESILWCSPNAIVSAGNDPEETTMRSAILGDPYSGVPCTKS